jgi:hypothetical protein
MRFDSIGSASGILKAGDGELFLVPPIPDNEIRLHFACESHRLQAVACLGRHVTAYGWKENYTDRPFPVAMLMNEIEVHPADSELPTLLDLCGSIQLANNSVDAVREMRDEW